MASSIPVQLDSGQLAVDEYSAAALLDLNGDGDMETGLSERSCEGSTIWVFEVDGAETVVGTSCGV